MRNVPLWPTIGQSLKKQLYKVKGSEIFSSKSFVFLLFSQNSIVGHNPVWFYSGNLFVKSRPVYKYFNAEQGKHWIFIRYKYWIERNVLNVFFVNFVIRAPGINLY